MAFFSKAEACVDKVQKKDNLSKQCTSIQEKDCCNNQTFAKEGNNTLKKSNIKFETETIVFLNTFLYTYINLFEGLEGNIVPFNDYRPPLLSKDIQVLDETYLV